MKISIPEASLVVLIGASGSGKSTFARKHFLPAEIISSDTCRGLVSDDESSLDASEDAFEVVHFLARKRLSRQKLTVIDATNVQPQGRKSLLAIAREHDCMAVAIVLDLPPKLCHERNQARADRQFGFHVVRQHSSQLRQSIRDLRREGFRYTNVLDSVEAIDQVTIERTRLWTNRRDDHGPFDIVGDVHGCFDELVDLLRTLGYEVDADAAIATPPAGRKAVFLGDLVDRGPGVTSVLKLVMNMARAGTALCIPGNHETKLLKKLQGRDVKVSHGLQETLDQLAREPAGFSQEVAGFIDRLVSHLVLDDGKLVVAHAGMKQNLQGRASGRVREFALYGETTGERDEFGLPIRYDWAADYRGRAMVVYGHTPVPEAEWLNRTICIDTGCVFGGKLTALRYPETELVQVPARRMYYAPVKPLRAEAAAAPQRAYGDLLDIGDVQGKRVITTRVHHTITVREENAAAALEVMSRFAVDPRWLIYLPPTMSPPETCKDGDYLEHPAEAFAYYRKEGVDRVICERKHMGSRAVIVVCRDEAAAAERFGIAGSRGAIYTRTGRPFFADKAMEGAVLDRIAAAVQRSGIWDELATTWLCLDAELMPWSAKAQELLRSQYAAVGSTARRSLTDAVAALESFATRTGQPHALVDRYRSRAAAAEAFVTAYRAYCWPVASIDDLEIAPFHLLASEGRVHVDRDHIWHLETLTKLAAGDPQLLSATAHVLVSLRDDESERAGVAWWEQLTRSGAEGMVVKPLSWLARGRRGLVQPAVKCRGREYLRIIYGAEYTAPEHLDRLRARALGAKRSLAIREYALGLETLHRFVEREPLYRVHECAFAVLALESEPVDPRL
ncbi:MAG TPA: polynucleotide kinase-phosphatase [Kofleriaceae bacterium]|nr:polynucleotide kinase-phosphatase [Kofleriaceae bacterium]